MRHNPRVSEQEQLLTNQILRHLHEVLDGYDQWLGTELIGSEAMSSISMSVTDVVQEDGFYRFVGTFTDSGPTDGRQKRLGAILSTLTVSEYANVKGPVKLNPDSAVVGLQVRSPLL